MEIISLVEYFSPLRPQDNQTEVRLKYPVQPKKRRLSYANGAILKAIAGSRRDSLSS